MAAGGKRNSWLEKPAILGASGSAPALAASRHELKICNFRSRYAPYFIVESDDSVIDYTPLE